MKTRLTHYERQIQHSWELMRQRQKVTEQQNKDEWDHGSKQFLWFVAIMLISLFSVGELLAYLCS